LAPVRPCAHAIKYFLFIFCDTPITKFPLLLLLCLNLLTCVFLGPLKAKENDASPLAHSRSRSPLPSPAKVTHLTKTIPVQKAPRVAFDILDEENTEETVSPPKRPRTTPRKSLKGKSPFKKGGPSPAKSSKSSLLAEFDSSKGFCPICQVPLACIKITKFAHTANCYVDDNSTGKTEIIYCSAFLINEMLKIECEDGTECMHTSWTHFRNYKHTQLAESRALEDSSGSDVEFISSAPVTKPLVVQNLSTLFEKSMEDKGSKAADNNPFLSSDEDEDPFKEYENVDNGGQIEPVVQFGDEEEEDLLKDKEVEPEDNNLIEESIPCVSGACDENKLSVAVTLEDGETIKVNISNFCVISKVKFELLLAFLPPFKCMVISQGLKVLEGVG